MIILNVNAYYQCANVSIISQSATFNASKTAISRYFFTSPPANPPFITATRPKTLTTCLEETICQKQINVYLCHADRSAEARSRAKRVGRQTFFWKAFIRTDS